MTSQNRQQTTDHCPVAALRPQLVVSCHGLPTQTSPLYSSPAYTNISPLFITCLHKHLPLVITGLHKNLPLDITCLHPHLPLDVTCLQRLPLDIICLHHLPFIHHLPTPASPLRHHLPTPTSPLRHHLPTPASPLRHHLPTPTYPLTIQYLSLIHI